MGSLQERVNLSQKVFGDNLVDYFRNNSMYMVDKYSKSDDMCEVISLSDISMGRFYFFHYEDPSNWMRYSPVFTIENKVIYIPGYGNSSYQILSSSEVARAINHLVFKSKIESGFLYLDLQKYCLPFESVFSQFIHSTLRTQIQFLILIDF